MTDSGVGGMGNERVALRRAVALGLDVASLAKVVYAGHAVPASQMIPPGVTGHDPAILPKSRYDPAAANALARPVRLRKARRRGVAPALRTARR